MYIIPQWTPNATMLKMSNLSYYRDKYPDMRSLFYILSLEHTLRAIYEITVFFLCFTCYLHIYTEHE